MKRSTATRSDIRMHTTKELIEGMILISNSLMENTDVVWLDGLVLDKAWHTKYYTGHIILLQTLVELISIQPYS